MLKYVADFLCKELMLIIEVDGFTHTIEEVQEKDKVRTKHLVEAGFYVLRFTDEQVLNDMKAVKEVISDYIEHYTKSVGTPSDAGGEHDAEE